MVGAAAALELAQTGWSVALLEHEAPAPFEADSVPDFAGFRYRLYLGVVTETTRCLAAGTTDALCTLSSVRDLGAARLTGGIRCSLALVAWGLWLRTGFCSWLCGNR